MKNLRILIPSGVFQSAYKSPFKYRLSKRTMRYLYRIVPGRRRCLTYKNGIPARARPIDSFKSIFIHSLFQRIMIPLGRYDNFIGICWQL